MAEETEVETEEETEAEMGAATEAASAAAETEAATETEAEAAMSLSPTAQPALATGERTAKMSRTTQCERTPQPSSAAGESEGIVPEPRRQYNPACSHDDAANPEKRRRQKSADLATRCHEKDSKSCTPTTTIVTGLQHWGCRRGSNHGRLKCQRPSI